MRTSAVHHMIAGIGARIAVDVNGHSEPLLWQSEFLPEAEKKRMMKRMF